MKNFLELRRLLPDPSQADFAPHFKHRTWQREFDITLIRQLWNHGDWRPYEETGWTIELPIRGENLVWSVGVYFDANDLPTFATVSTRLPHRQKGWTWIRAEQQPLNFVAYSTGGA